MTQGTIEKQEYLRELRAEWLKNLRTEVIEPIRETALRHPLLREVSTGAFPIHKLRRMFADLCWIIITTPEVVASLAARTPTYLHDIKTRLLNNAQSEWNHSWALSQTVTALGGPGEMILKGPEYVWEPLSFAWHLRNWQLVYAFHRPWIEGIAAFAVGIESLVPTVFYPIWKGCEKHYGLSGEALLWLEWHGGEVEQEHGNDGLLILEEQVRADDVKLQLQLRSVIKKTMLVLGPQWLDFYYANSEPAAATARHA